MYCVGRGEYEQTPIRENIDPLYSPPQSQYNAKEYIDEILTKDIPRGRRSMAGKTLYPLEFRLSMYMGTSAGKAAGMMVPKLNMVWILHVQD